MLKHFWYTVLWLVVLTILSLLPGNDIPTSNWLEQIHADKIVHVGMYAMLTFLLLLSMSHWKKKEFSHWRKAFPFIIFAMSYGVSMELMQLFFTDSRKFEVADMVANAGGAFIGFFVFRFFSKILAKNKGQHMLPQ